jgi:hypothetical protein
MFIGADLPQHLSSSFRNIEYSFVISFMLKTLRLSQICETNLFVCNEQVRCFTAMNKIFLDNYE